MMKSLASWTFELVSKDEQTTQRHHPVAGGLG